jgi:RNA-binding protein 39
MGDLDAIPNCLLLNNIVPDFQKFPILVKASEAEKNFVAKKETPLYDPVGDSRLYIGNLHMNVTEGELRTVLSQYGQVDMVSIHRDELGVSKGYSFCKFAFPDHASQAMSKLSGFELMGKPLKVGYITDHASSASTAASGHGSGNWKLDDDDGSGLQMNAQSRAMLMNKLGQAAGMQMPKPLAPPTAGFGVPLITGAPTRCFKIRNMFDPATETEPNWDMDVKEDVTEECAKFGAVEHCFVESKKPGGIVFVRFANVDSSREAANSLNGRFFAGRQITIEYIDPAKYSTLF